jgi:hypothetical protein
VALDQFRVEFCLVHHGSDYHSTTKLAD